MFLTVGHSDLEWEDFRDLVHGAGATTVVDVRRLAGSSRVPHFNADVLAESLRASGVGYLRIATLTGRRPLQREIDPAVNAGWRNQSFHNYADWALGSDFESGLHELESLEATGTPAVMCAEAVWWRCHRRLIADNLLARGHEVAHVMGKGRVTPASMTTGAVVMDNLHVTYPSEDR